MTAFSMRYMHKITLRLHYSHTHLNIKAYKWFNTFISAQFITSTLSRRKKEIRPALNFQFQKCTSLFYFPQPILEERHHIQSIAISALGKKEKRSGEGSRGNFGY